MGECLEGWLRRGRLSEPAAARRRARLRRATARWWASPSAGCGGLDKLDQRCASPSEA